MSDEHDTHHVNYLLIFGILCGFTATSAALDVIDLPYGVLVVGVLAVSVAKAMCVLMFFMHLKFEGNWKYVILLPTTILGIGLPLALLPDIGIHYYVLDVPQNKAGVVAGAHHGDETADEEGQDD
jgi:cytochrome c oxidase subunit 4